jgi:hypothetical protein
MNRKVLAVGTSLVVAASLLAGVALQADDPRTAAAQGKLTGKIVVIWLRSDPETSAALENAEVRQLGTHAFLVGKGIDDGSDDNWQKGQFVWLAMDDIAQLTEFANLDSYKKALPAEDDLAQNRRSGEATLARRN